MGDELTHIGEPRLNKADINVDNKINIIQVHNITKYISIINQEALCALSTYEQRYIIQVI